MNQRDKEYPANDLVYIGRPHASVLYDE